jgi:hypothetical protein
MSQMIAAAAAGCAQGPSTPPPAEALSWNAVACAPSPPATGLPMTAVATMSPACLMAPGADQAAYASQVGTRATQSLMA